MKQYYAQPEGSRTQCVLPLSTICVKDDWDNASNCSSLKMTYEEEEHVLKDTAPSMQPYGVDVEPPVQTRSELPPCTIYTFNDDDSVSDCSDSTPLDAEDNWKWDNLRRRVMEKHAAKREQAKKATENVIDLTQD